MNGCTGCKSLGEALRKRREQSEWLSFRLMQSEQELRYSNYKVDKLNYKVDALILRIQELIKKNGNG